MEYSLTVCAVEKKAPENVLILILMEYSLTRKGQQMRGMYPCLNPYSNGILPDIPKKMLRALKFVCLNPYSNGILPDILNTGRKER